MLKQFIRIAAACFEFAYALQGAELVCETQDLSRDVCEQLACCHWSTSLGCMSSTGSASCETAYPSSTTPEDARSGNGSDTISIIFKNNSDKPTQMWWHDGDGNKVSYGTIYPGETLDMSTYTTHAWTATGPYNPDVTFVLDGESVFVGDIYDNQSTISITEGYVLSGAEVICETTNFS